MPTLAWLGKSDKALNPELIAPITLAIFVVAALYASVGHAGASGYIAVMTLAGIAPLTLKPTALALNILVAALAVSAFARAGYFSWRLFWPLGASALPCAYLGGYLNLPAPWFNAAVGLILLGSALRFLLRPSERADIAIPHIALGLLVGSVLGFLAGLTGTGGGIFLTPLLIIAGWATTKTAAAIAALFILVNSSAGLLGFMQANGHLPNVIAPWALAALLGGSLGAYLGSKKLPVLALQRCLALVLTIAGLKLLFA